MTKEIAAPALDNGAGRALLVTIRSRMKYDGVEGISTHKHTSCVREHVPE